MSHHPTTKHKLFHVGDTAKAWQFAQTAQLEGSFWVPRSVVPSVLKHPPRDGKASAWAVEIEDWWLEKNPLPKLSAPGETPRAPAPFNREQSLF